MLVTLSQWLLLENKWFTKYNNKSNKNKSISNNNSNNNNKGTRNRDLGFACQMRNYCGQKKGGWGEGGMGEEV